MGSKKNICKLFACQCTIEILLNPCDLIKVLMHDWPLVSMIGQERRWAELTQRQGIGDQNKNWDKKNNSDNINSPIFQQSPGWKCIDITKTHQRARWLIISILQAPRGDWKSRQGIMIRLVKFRNLMREGITTKKAQWLERDDRQVFIKISYDKKSWEKRVRDELLKFWYNKKN